MRPQQPTRHRRGAFITTMLVCWCSSSNEYNDTVQPYDATYIAYVLRNCNALLVPQFCLAKMATAPAAATLRALQGIPEPSAHLGLIAAHYGMHEEAVALLTQAGRHDLLAHVLQVGAHVARMPSSVPPGGFDHSGV